MTSNELKEFDERMHAMSADEWLRVIQLAPYGLLLNEIAQRSRNLANTVDITIGGAQ